MSVEKNVLRAAKLDTATISDALDRLDINGQCRGIQARADSFKVCGRAYTLKYGPAAVAPGTVGDYIDDVPPGAIIVLDNGGRLDCTVWGDILTEIAHRREIGGTVIHGICRDVSLCRKLDYPVFSNAHWMRTGKDRVQVESVGQAVSLGDVRVCVGDLVVGDADGVIVIPQEHEDRVLAVAEEIHEAENAIRDSARSGMRLDEARVKFRYHELQKKNATGELG